jgi:cation transport ATPase
MNQNRIHDSSTIVEDKNFQNAISEIKNNPQVLKAYLKDVKDGLLKDIERQKEITFDKAYGDLDIAITNQASVLSLENQSKEMNHLQSQITQEQAKNMQHLEDDKNMAERKYEMNEWSVQNKKETLFLYSMFFILVTGIVLLAALLNMGIISTTFFIAFVIPFVLLFIMIFMYRARYTAIHRNQRYWNRRAFQEDKFGKIRLPTICAQENVVNTSRQPLPLS